MITKKLKTIKGYVEISMPEKLEEVTLGQLITVQQTEHLGDLQAISILSGTPLSTLQNVTHADELQVFSTQVQNIAHQIIHLYNGDTIPGEVTFNIDEKPIKVKAMKNLSVEPAGAFMAAREIIADEIAKHITEHGEADWQEHFNPSLQACAQVLAQYFFCRATGKPYNEYAAVEFEEQVKLLPVTDALPIAKYFFLSYPNLSKPRTGCWHRLLRRWSSAPA
jgi:hypothetical protein